MSCDTDDLLDLPALTDETLEVPLLAWSPDIPDPTALTWRSNVSATYDRWPGAAPPLSDSGWVAATIVDRGDLTVPKYRILVRVSALPAGRHGVWVRVVGSAGSSPVRWAGAVVAR
jgi:hypothetical protein